MVTAQREEWRRLHQQSSVEPRFCYCLAPWPCAVPSLLAQLDEAEVREKALRAALEDAARQWGYWSEREGGVGTGGLSTLEDIFALLGWDDPHPLPDRRCDEPGCMKDGTMGWPTGLAEPRYRHTCWDHSDTGKARAALTGGSSEGGNVGNT